MAKKKRLIYLLEKLQKGTLSNAEIKELEERETEIFPKMIVETQKSVGKAFQVNYKTVGRWKKAGMPWESGKYNLAQIKEWLLTKEEKKQNHNKGKNDFWDTSFREFKARLMKIEYEVRVGELIEEKDVLEAFVQRIIAVKRGLLALPRALAPQLVGLEMRQIENALRSSVEGLIKNFSVGGKFLKKNEKS
ncbi:MAG: hypothetical protein NTW64_01750 [Candidatus Omnitrophica bacterium]|nr:hypothetical protein [Candidatus Omnitrophota bacterium]